MRKRLLLLLALLAIVATIAVFRLTPPTPGVTKENALRLEHGMTRLEVETLFGMRGTPDRGYFVWTDKDTTFSVYILFDETGYVLIGAYLLDAEGNFRRYL